MGLTGNHALDTAMSLACDANPKSEDIPQAVAGTLYAEVIRQRVIIEDIRALLTSGPVSPRHMPFTAGACANDEWVAAIRKALGE